jgi:hypothetical protein
MVYPYDVTAFHHEPAVPLLIITSISLALPAFSVHNRSVRNHRAAHPTRIDSQVSALYNRGGRDGVRRGWPHGQTERGLARTEWCRPCLPASNLHCVQPL